MASKVTVAGQITGTEGTFKTYKGVELPPAPERTGLVRREPRWNFKAMEPDTSMMVPYTGTDAEANKKLFKAVSASAASVARKCRDDGALRTFAVRELAGKTPGVGVWCVKLDKALPPRMVQTRQKRTVADQAANISSTAAAPTAPTVEGGDQENPFG